MAGRRPRNAPIDPEIDAALLEALAPIEPPRALREALKSRVLARARDGEGPAGFLTVRAHEGAWRPIAPRVMEKRLVAAAGLRACLVRLAPGASLPAHEHPTPEECVVLEGEVWLGETLCAAGDFHFAPQGLAHGPIRSPAGCLLYVRTGGAVRIAKRG